jgi:hypothetical protein
MLIGKGINKTMGIFFIIKTVSLCDFNFDLIVNTTRKPEKTNGITYGIFPSVIYTDGNNSVSKSVGIYRRNKPVGETVGIY